MKYILKKEDYFVKRIVSVLLCIILCLGMFCMPASALSKSAGMKALQSLFVDGQGHYFDYVFYSPVKSGYTVSSQVCLSVSSLPVTTSLSGQPMKIKQKFKVPAVLFFICPEIPTQILPGAVKAQSSSAILIFSFQDIQITSTPTEFI